MQPNLLNSIYVEIKQIDEDSTVYDPRRREPVNRVKRWVAFKIKAQIFWTDDQYVDATKGAKPDDRGLGGNILNSIGYIVVRKIDLKKLGKTLTPGDKLTEYGSSDEISTTLYLVGKKDAAHYSDKGQCTLEKWFFRDRA